MNSEHAIVLLVAVIVAYLLVAVHSRLLHSLLATVIVYFLFAIFSILVWWLKSWL